MMNTLLRSTMAAMPMVIVLIEMYRRRMWESHADLDRGDIRRIAERAARDAASVNAVLEQFPAVKEDRHLRPVRRNRNA